jgi:beta-phosphoglucomutase-like phosphatase (HAD superfamily)
MYVCIYIYTYIYIGKIPLRPGVVELVKELITAKVTVAVCSTSNEKAVR